MKKKKSRVTLRGLKTHTVKYGAAINKSLNTLISNTDSLVKALDHQKKTRPKCCLIVPFNYEQNKYHKPPIWMAVVFDLPIDPFPGLVMKVVFDRILIDKVSFNLSCRMYECETKEYIFSSKSMYEELLKYLPVEGWYIYKNEGQINKIQSRTRTVFSCPMGD